MSSVQNSQAMAAAERALVEKIGGIEKLRAQTFVPLRKDLVVVRQRYEEEWYAVIKDPISSDLVRIDWEDYEIAHSVEKEISFGELLDSVLRSRPELILAFSEERLLLRFRALITNLRKHKLAITSGRELASLKALKRQQKRAMMVKKSMVGWLRMTKDLVDPDRFLARITPWFRFVFTRWFQVASILVVINAVFVLFKNLDEARFDPGWFVNPVNLISLSVCVILLKLVHEIGHGVTVKHYGGEVHEAGFMLLCFHPLFYVNTSDAWLFPDKYRRMAVSAAGIYVELLAAAILVPVWASLQPGLLKDFTFNAIVVASVSTLIFNGNPLFKFDGYFILSDWLEIPNLRQKAMAYVGSLFRGLFYGKNAPSKRAQPFSPRSRKTLAIYAILSVLYIAFVMTNIFGMLDSALDMVGLRFFALILLVLFLSAILILPLVGIFRDSLDKKLDLARNTRIRPWATAVLLLFGFFLLSLIPYPVKVKRSCILEAEFSGVVRAAEPGFLAEIPVVEGQAVTKDQPLAFLYHPDLEIEIQIQKAQIGTLDAGMQMANYNHRPDLYQQYTHLRGEIQAQLDLLLQRRDSLTLRAPADGLVVTRNLQEKLGSYLDAGDALMVVAPQDEFPVLIPVSEREARFIHVGAPVRLKLHGFPARVFHGEIAREPLASLGDRIPASLTAKRGGDVYSTVGESGKEEVMESQWYATLYIRPDDEHIRLGMTGRVSINCGWRSVGQSIRQRFLDFINIDYRI